MSDVDENLRMDVEDDELIFEDEMLVRHLRRSLKQVVTQNEVMKMELANVEKQNTNLLNHKYKCLNTAGLPVIPDIGALVARLKHVGSKTDSVVHALSSLIKFKKALDKSYDKHCKEAKKVTEEHIKINFDQYTKMSDKELQEVIVQMKKAQEETLVKIGDVKCQVDYQQLEYSIWYKELVNSIVALTKVVQDATERHETLQREDALETD